MRYFIYCRKSSEAEDRQALSIASQLSELNRAFGADRAIEIVEIVQESYSAKAPGRPLFDGMLTRIERGDAEGIIAWHPDRLARNSVDGGKIVWFLDRGLLKDLKFATYTFENNPQGKFMLSIFLGQSKYYVDSLSVNVKRGNRQKIENGWRPNRAPLGYVNDRATKTIAPDPERFALVRRIFDLELTGSYSMRDIACLSRSWGLKTQQSKRMGGKDLTTSMVHFILHNRFYAGEFTWNGVLYPGSHRPMVTRAEFRKVQVLLRRPTKASPEKHRFPFTGLMRCGECDSGITAEKKINRYGSSYTYYHCTRKHLVRQCKQGAIRAEQLEEAFAAFIESVRLSPRLHKWLLVQIGRAEETRVEEQRARAAALEKSLSALATERANLTTLRLRDLIGDEEFATERRRIDEEHGIVTEMLQSSREGQDWIEPAQTAISGLSRAIFWFRAGDLSTKRQIVEAVGSNPTLIDRKLKCDAVFPCFTEAKSTRCPSRLADLDELRTLWERQDPKYLKAVEIFRELLERDRREAEGLAA